MWPKRESPTWQPQDHAATPPQQQVHSPAGLTPGASHRPSDVTSSELKGLSRAWPHWSLLY